MKDVTPEKTPKSAKIEDTYITKHDESKFLIWLGKQNWFLWGCIAGVLIALYRNFDRIVSWFS